MEEIKCGCEEGREPEIDEIYFNTSTYFRCLICKRTWLKEEQDAV